MFHIANYKYLLEKFWYRPSAFSWVFYPFSFIYQMIICLRRSFLTRFFQQQFPVPIVVVGNLTLGGVGKTPLVIALVKACQEKGLRVGVVSRGYGAQRQQFPYEVGINDNAEDTGDEPLLIARKCRCPVVIAPKRVDAVKLLLEKHQSQIIISDDGLQHYRMGRALEIIVLDGSRLFGNGLCFPFGPLREGRRRLKEADFIIVNEGEREGAYSMQLKSGAFYRLHSREEAPIDSFLNPIAAVAGIGNPWKFFRSLSALGLEFTAYAFPDHYRFNQNHWNFNEKTILMTEKDAVKCESFTPDNCFVLPVEAQLSDAFWQAFWSHERLKGLFR